MITQQPPTPASASEPLKPAPTPRLGTSQGPPIFEREVKTQSPPLTRGRSATYTAKSAVADVVRRFHPEHREAVH